MNRCREVCRGEHVVLVIGCGEKEFKLFFGKEAEALCGGGAAGGGVFLSEVALFFQGGKMVAKGCRAGGGESELFEHLRADGFSNFDIALDKGDECLELPQLMLASRAGFHC